VNSKIRILLEHWDFHDRNVDDTWYLLEWIAWDLYEFPKATIISKYLISDPCTFYTRSYYAPFWCGLCNSFGYDINSCPYYACYAQPDFVSSWDNADVVLTLLDSTFPLAQCTGLDVGDSFVVDARFSVLNACCESENILDEMHDLNKTPLDESRDVLVHEEVSMIGFSPILLIIPMFHLFVHYPLFPSSIL